MSEPPVALSSTVAVSVTSPLLIEGFGVTLTLNVTGPEETSRRMHTASLTFPSASAPRTHTL